MIVYKPDHSFMWNNYNLNYSIKGKGEFPILFLHGFGLSTYSWVFVEDKFDLDKYFLILVDLKGSGFSDKPKNGDYSISAQAEIVTALLSYLNVIKFNLIAHSYGGIVGLYLLYLNNGKNIPKVILIDTPGFGDTTPFFIKALRNPILSFIGLKLIPTKFLVSQIIKQTFYNNKLSVQRLLKQYRFFYSMKYNDRAMIQLAKQLVPKNIDEIINNYENIVSDILIVWGSEDELIDLEVGIKLQNKFRQSKLVIIQECGHVPHEEKPDEFFEKIDSFIN